VVVFFCFGLDLAFELELVPGCISLSEFGGGIDSESHISDGKAESSVKEELRVEVEVEVVDKF
jgi:hypothetical protein